MNNHYIKALVICGIAITSISSCKKKDKNEDPSVRAYTVPTTYSFGNENYASSTTRVKMAVELDSYLKTANAGSTTISLLDSKITGMWNNTGNQFSDAGLNASGLNLSSVTADANLYKSYADSVRISNTGTAASQGTAGYIVRGTNKIIVGPRGLEYGQAYTKGIMGALLFKEAVRLLTSVKTMSVKDTAAAQAAWDEAFGYLAVPANYDTSVTYVNTDPNRPLLWGGYLAERGRDIQAGGIIFAAFLKGRAAIGGYDRTVRNQQVDVILDKWEQLAAAAALAYVTSPTTSSAAGNLGTQFHALSEGFGFILSLQHRAATSKLSAADFTTLNNIIHKDFYDLINQTGFTDLVTAQNILKNTYGL
ncbi:MAG: DUF4856 domain-containing protein [Taibaiella sp.]|nr:DUF4856 domain-containing protein [Taibaiella sp.]